MTAGTQHVTAFTRLTKRLTSSRLTAVHAGSCCAGMNTWGRACDSNKPKRWRCPAPCPLSSARSTISAYLRLDRAQSTSFASQHAGSPATTSATGASQLHAGHATRRSDQQTSYKRPPQSRGPPQDALERCQHGDAPDDEGCGACAVERDSESRVLAGSPGVGDAGAHLGAAPLLLAALSLPMKFSGVRASSFSAKMPA